MNVTGFRIGHTSVSFVTVIALLSFGLTNLAEATRDSVEVIISMDVDTVSYSFWTNFQNNIQGAFRAGFNFDFHCSASDTIHFGDTYWGETSFIIDTDGGLIRKLEMTKHLTPSDGTPDIGGGITVRFDSLELSVNPTGAFVVRKKAYEGFRRWAVYSDIIKFRNTHETGQQVDSSWFKDSLTLEIIPLRSSGISRMAIDLDSQLSVWSPTARTLHASFPASGIARQLEIFNEEGECLEKFSIRPGDTQLTFERTSYCNGVFFARIGSKITKFMLIE
jgi:hypothetical protein